MGKGLAKSAVKGLLPARLMARQQLAASLRPGPATSAAPEKANPQEATAPAVFSVQKPDRLVSSVSKEHRSMAALKAV